VPDADADRLAEGITARSVGRFRGRDLSIFPAELLAEVEGFGFSLS
jgi:hypothetical protein